MPKRITLAPPILILALFMGCEQTGPSTSGTTVEPQKSLHPINGPSWNDENDPAFLYHSRSQATPGGSGQQQSPNVKKIYLRDLELRRSDTRAITGDLRPYYVVSGRIQNDTGKTLGGVTIRVFVESRGTPDSTSRDYNEHWQVFDQADISVKASIADLSVRGFSQQVQLLPPTSEPWTWEADVIEAEAANSAR